MHLSEIGFNSKGIPNLSPRDALKVLDKGAILIDLRKEFFWRWKQFDVESVVCLPKEEVSKFIEGSTNYTHFILSETSTSEKASDIISKLMRRGFTNIYNLAGGFVEWEREGCPIIENKRHRLSGSCMCQLKPRSKSRDN